MPSLSWSSSVLISCSSHALQIQRTISLSANDKGSIVSLNSDHFSQPYSKHCAIQKLKMLAQFLSDITRLVIIGNSCLEVFHTAVMCALVASAQPPNSPFTSAKY